jgi:hypothetical protein
MVSIFEEELRFHLAAPDTPYFIARQRAIDYTRRYTRRELPIDHLISLEDGFESGGVINTILLEISPDAFLLQEGNFIDANLSPESRALFNDLVRKLFQFIESAGDRLDGGIAIIFLARIIRVGNLEHILSEDLQAVVQGALGDRTPWTLLDLSILCGYHIRKRSTLDKKFQRELGKIQNQLRKYLGGSYEGGS